MAAGLGGHFAESEISQQIISLHADNIMNRMKGHRKPSQSDYAEILFLPKIISPKKTNNTVGNIMLSEINNAALMSYARSLPAFHSRRDDDYLRLRGVPAFSAALITKSYRRLALIGRTVKLPRRSFFAAQPSHRRRKI